MEEIIKEAEEFALSEIEKYGLPSKINFETANEKGEELAEELNVNVNIVKIGTRLMDIKLGEAISKGNPKEHLRLGKEATRNFLEKFDLDKEVKEKMINCVEGHHSKNWNCKEAEICANADCYRFLLIENWLHLIYSFDKPFNETLHFAEKKADEKWNILSIDKCKEELKDDYKLIKKIVNKAKSGN